MPAFNIRLTLTWDVLKSAPDIAGLPATWININMRCIEIILLENLSVFYSD